MALAWRWRGFDLVSQTAYGFGDQPRKPTYRYSTSEMIWHPDGGTAPRAEERTLGLKRSTSVLQPAPEPRAAEECCRGWTQRFDTFRAFAVSTSSWIRSPRTSASR